MRPYRGNDLACVCCFETCCFGCEVAARDTDPYYESDNGEQEDDEE